MNKHSCGKWPTEIDLFKVVIFNSYVELPEGNNNSVREGIVNQPCKLMVHTTIYPFISIFDDDYSTPGECSSDLARLRRSVNCSPIGVGRPPSIRASCLSAQPGFEDPISQRVWLVTLRFCRISWDFRGFYWDFNEDGPNVL